MRAFGVSRRSAVSSVLLMGSLLPDAARAERLVILGDDSYAPVIHSVGGQPRGFLVDLLLRVQSLGGDSFDIQLMPWKRAYEMARRLQGGLIGVSRTREREQFFDFSKPVYDDDIHLAVLKGREFEFRGLPDLRGKVLGGVTGASYGETVDRAIREGLFTVERDIGQTSRLRKLMHGRMDAALIGNGVAGFEQVLSSHPELMANRDRFVLLPVPLVRDPLHLAFAKELRKTQVLARFDAAVARLAREKAAAQG